MSARFNPFLKLNAGESRRGQMPDAMPTRALWSGAVLLARGGGALPEVATDVIDLAANYAVENVKRDRPTRRSVTGQGLGQWLERMLSSRAARP